MFSCVVYGWLNAGMTLQAITDIQYLVQRLKEVASKR